MFEFVLVSPKVMPNVGIFLFGGPGFRQLKDAVQLNVSSSRTNSETVVSGPFLPVLVCFTVKLPVHCVPIGAEAPNDTLNTSVVSESALASVKI